MRGFIAKNASKSGSLRNVGCCEHARFEHPLHIPQEAFVLDLLAQHDFQQAVINRAEGLDNSLNDAPEVVTIHDPSHPL
jgi:hypothetical protein